MTVIQLPHLMFPIVPNSTHNLAQEMITILAVIRLHAACCEHFSCHLNYLKYSFLLVLELWYICTYSAVYSKETVVDAVEPGSGNEQ